MATDPNILMRRYLRFTRYLPVQCTALTPEETEPRPLGGITRNVNAGGLEILLPEALPVNTMLSVRISASDPLPGHVVSVSEGIPTLLGTRFPHGVAFEEPVDPSVVRQWVSQPKKRAHARAPVQFEVEYTQGGTTGYGTCFNLSLGGMFIVTDHPAAPETEIVLDFTLPSLSDPLSVRVRVAWVSGEDTEPRAVCGMGVRFIDLTPADAVAIGSLVGNFSEEASVPTFSKSSPPTQ